MIRSLIPTQCPSHLELHAGVKTGPIEGRTQRNGNLRTVGCDVGSMHGVLVFTRERTVSAYGRFERSFTLPDEADPDKISSEYKEGILTIHLPKNPNVKTKARQITVQ
ncbi:MAG: Hsp20 family protein [Terrimicrobiaceae bacterium]